VRAGCGAGAGRGRGRALSHAAQRGHARRPGRAERRDPSRDRVVARRVRTSESSDYRGYVGVLPHFCEFFKSTATSTKGLPFTYADRINR
jgi:hypothetical protein